MRHLLYALAAYPAVALAECPPVNDRTMEMAALIDAARASQNEAEGRVYAREMWTIWVEAPDEPAQALLDTGLAALQVSDFARAIESFDRLVAYCPHYAEGWNQRAFANYLSGDYAAALPDLMAAVEINPVHTGAITGIALTLIQLGREDEAQGYILDALELNPWLSERHLLKAPPGDDL